jgi:hypothetical protein
MSKQDLVFEAVLNKLGSNLSSSVLARIEQMINDNRSVKDIVKAVK